MSERASERVVGRWRAAERREGAVVGWGSAQARPGWAGTVTSRAGAGGLKQQAVRRSGAVARLITFTSMVDH